MLQVISHRRISEQPTVLQGLLPQQCNKAGSSYSQSFATHLNEAAFAALLKYGYVVAYQFSERKRDTNDPLFSIRRIIASGYWSARTLHNAMLNSFKHPVTS